MHDLLSQNEMNIRAIRAFLTLIVDRNPYRCWCGRCQWMGGLWITSHGHQGCRLSLLLCSDVGQINFRLLTCHINQSSQSIIRHIPTDSVRKSPGTAGFGNGHFRCSPIQLLGNNRFAGCNTPLTGHGHVRPGWWRRTSGRGSTYSRAGAISAIRS